MSNLHQASRQWANRPADERFKDLPDLKQAVLDRRNISYEGDIKVNTFKVEPQGETVVLNAYGKKLDLTHWSFGQLCRFGNAPSAYLRTLPANLVADNLNYSVPKNKEIAKVLLAYNGGAEVRAFTSTTYGRIWDIDVVKKVMGVCETNPSWHNPPAMAVNGSENAGLYASDRDVFMFLVDEDHKLKVVNNNGKENELSRGFFVWNSEVGKASFGLMTFLYNYVCGNHIVWGAQDVKEIRIRHSKNAPLTAFGEVIPKLKQYVTSSIKEEEQALKKAVEYRPVKDRDGMVDWLTKNGFNKAIAESSITYAEEKEGDATSLWNIVQGITYLAREKTHIDNRLTLERQAGKLLNYVSR